MGKRFRATKYKTKQISYPRKHKVNSNVERNNRIIQEEYYLQYCNNLTTNISSLKIFVKQIQNHYNFISFHRNFKFNDRLFSSM